VFNKLCRLKNFVDENWWWLMPSPFSAQKLSVKQIVLPPLP
jgi:hypothetical protein